MQGRMIPIVATAVLIVHSGCDLFKTREPELPTQSSANFTQPTEPAIVFSNMSNAFRDMNSVNYVRSLSDSSTSGRSFQFEPTVQAASRYGGVFVGWTKQSEQQYFESMIESMKSKISSGGSMLLEFLSLTEQSRQPESSQYNATYRLTVQHTQPNIASQVRGQSQFYLIADRSRNWVIWRWVDLAQNSADSTWSDLKGGFGQ